MVRCLIPIVFAVAFPVASTAQEIPKEVGKLFERLAGKWDVVSTLEGTSVKQKLTANKTANGEGLIWHWEGTDLDSGQVATAVGLMGWDGQQRVIVENMVSSNGVTFSATWSGSGDRWTSKTRGVEFIGGEYKTSFEERVMEWESDDKVVIVSKNRLVSGKPQAVMQGVYDRKK